LYRFPYKSVSFAYHFFDNSSDLRFERERVKKSVFWYKSLSV